MVAVYGFLLASLCYLSSISFLHLLPAMTCESRAEIKYTRALTAKAPL
jgi:hypothetical protein